MRNTTRVVVVPQQPLCVSSQGGSSRCPAAAAALSRCGLIPHTAPGGVEIATPRDRRLRGTRLSGGPSPPVPPLQQHHRVSETPCGTVSGRGAGGAQGQQSDGGALRNSRGEHGVAARELAHHQGSAYSTAQLHASVQLCHSLCLAPALQAPHAHKGRAWTLMWLVCASTTSKQ